MVEQKSEHLDHVFHALAHPVRREILRKIARDERSISQLAEPFDMSLQAVSRHIQVLVRAGLVKQARTGRISRCSLDAGPIADVAVWINRYSKYWQDQFNVLAVALQDIDERNAASRESTRRKADKTPPRKKR
jgi:DNA-binding transcriptional ArsR family regulator